MVKLGTAKNAKKLMKNGRTRDQLEKKVTKTSSKKTVGVQLIVGLNQLSPRIPPE